MTTATTAAEARAATGSTDTVTTVTTKRGITCDVLVLGADAAPPLVYLHSAGGHLGGEPMLHRLAGRYRVYAPVWPGYGDAAGEELLEDMLDFALHGSDVVTALGLGTAPHLVGHSMGGMIAAEMAAISPGSYDRVALIAPVGLWLDEHPVVDLFSLLPFEFPEYLFEDTDAGAALLTGGFDFNDPSAIKDFLVRNSRRLGTAGKILFPIPDRRASKRLYRIANPALVLWGDADRLVPPVYAREWQGRLPNARIAYVDGGRHMVPYERPDEVAVLLSDFLG
jgi:pimeloyl-ACP methyl ester carboxylesterase